MNLDDYTKELFGGLDGWFQRSGVYGKGSFQTMDRSSSIEFEQATQIAKEVQRREIEARLDELNTLTEWKVNDTGDDNYDILYAHHKRVYDDRIVNLEQQLKELEEK